MPAGIAPAVMAAVSKITHSGRLYPRMPTVPPAGSPSAIIDLAAWLTWPA